MSGPVTGPPAYAGVEVGTRLPTREVRLRRADLVRYAGASGDFNPIHWNERFARSVGLPDVIAHGMLTMAVGARLLVEWTGDPGAVLEYGVRFTRPVVVGDGLGPDDGAVLVVGGTVTEKLPDGSVRVELDVRCDGEPVLARARAVVRLG